MYSKITIVFSFFFNICFSQGLKIDSLLTLIRGHQTEENRANTFNQLATLYSNQNNYSKALNFYLNELNIWERLGNKTRTSASYDLISDLYRSQENYQEALKYSFKRLRIQKDLSISLNGGYEDIGTTYDNIASMYLKLRCFSESHKYYLLSLSRFQKLNDKHSLSYEYSNIGNFYSETSDLNQALNYHLQAFRLSMEQKDTTSLIFSSLNIGDIHFKRSNFKKALENYLLAYNLASRQSQTPWNESIYLSLAQAYQNQGEINVARKYYDKAYELLDSKEEFASFYLNLTKLDSLIKDYQAGYTHHKLYVAYKDSIEEEKNHDRTSRIQMNYEFGKREAEQKAEQDKKDALTKLELEARDRERNYYIAGLLFFVIFAGYFFYSYRQKQKDNHIIAQQKSEVEKQKKVIEEKQKDIIDSIQYAKRIQRSQLPTEKYIERNLSNLRKD
jgi:tetratricopeptide (TPR) repeat protein